MSLSRTHSRRAGPLVLVLSNALSGGGSERVAVALANNLAAAGVRTVLMTVWNSPHDLVRSDVDVVELGKEFGRGLRDVPRTVARYRRVVRLLQPTVVHAHGEIPELLAVLTPPSLGARLCATEHAGDPWRDWPRMGAVVRACLRRRHARWSVPQQRMQVWHIGAADIVTPNPLIEPEQLWEPASLQPQPLRVVGVGRLVPLKRWQWLLSAAASLNGGVEATIIGDGVARSDLERLAGRIGAPVNFAGHLENPWPNALQHDLYVSTSAIEADPLSVAEAIVHEMPVLVSGIPAHRGQGLSGPRVFDTEAELHDRLASIVSGTLPLTDLVATSAAAQLRSTRTAGAVVARCVELYGCDVVSAASR